MNRSPTRVGGWCLLLGGVVLAGLSGGCQKTLFADSDPSTSWKLQRYYHNDSAVQTSEDRKKASDMGFGLPLGGDSGGPGGY